VFLGAQRPVGTAARGFDADVGAGDLSGEVGQAAREVAAMRYDYDPDHAFLRSSGVVATLHCRRGFDNAEY
jgi:hypothetical protein